MFIGLRSYRCFNESTNETLENNCFLVRFFRKVGLVDQRKVKHFDEQKTTNISTIVFAISICFDWLSGTRSRSSLRLWSSIVHRLLLGSLMNQNVEKKQGLCFHSACDKKSNILLQIFTCENDNNNKTRKRIEKKKHKSERSLKTDN